MKRVLSIGLAVVGFLAIAAPVLAHKFPDRIVTTVAPYPAGGPTDELARVVAENLSKKSGQNFIVENITGGGTIIGTIPDMLLHQSAILKLTHQKQNNTLPHIKMSTAQI
jgi:tripartite-type tricarboxylate transporter receptor subunit TctC